MSQQEHLEWLVEGKLSVLPPPPQCTSIVSSKKRFTTRTLAGYSVLTVELVNLKNLTTRDFTCMDIEFSRVVNL
jgi:hypothetical protein